MNRNLIYGVLILSLAGCAVGPKYNPPEISLCDEWTVEDLCKTSFVEAEVNPRWWEVFNDPLLTQCIEKAAAHNYNVLIAEENIRQARAIKMIATSQLFPQLLLDFNGSKTYFSKNGPVFSGPSLAEGVNTNTGLPFTLQIPQMQSLYNALIDANWEIDIFGKVRNQITAKKALVSKAEDDRNNILISIFAEIAINYMQLRRSQQIGKLLEKNIRLFEEYLSIEEVRKKTGYAKTLDVLAVEAKLAIAKAEMPLSYGNIYQSIYAISVLTGEKPESLLSELLPIKELPALPEEIAIGLRSDLIRRRPDINAAERSLASATANVGVAVANFLPSIKLGGDIGFQSLKFINLFSGMSKTWTVGGDVNMPLFQGGRLVGNLRLTESQAIAAAQNYSQTVLTALQEVETALVHYKCDAQTLLELRRAAEKDAASLNITDEQHRYGYVSQVSCIESALGLNTSLALEAEACEVALKDLIVLYKALGGGFEPFPLEK